MFWKWALPPKRHKSCLLLQLKLIYVLRLLASFENLIISANRLWECWIYILSAELYWSQCSIQTCCFILTLYASSRVISGVCLPQTWRRNFKKKRTDVAVIIVLSVLQRETVKATQQGRLFEKIRASLLARLIQVGPEASVLGILGSFFESFWKMGANPLTWQSPCDKWQTDTHQWSHGDSQGWPALTLARLVSWHSERRTLPLLSLLSEPRLWRYLYILE